MGVVFPSLRSESQIGRFLETLKQAKTTIGYFGFCYRNRSLIRVSERDDCAT
jgi:hypothetical protein